LATGDTLHTLADLYGISKSSASIIVREVCEGIKTVLRPLVFPKPTLSRMKQIALEFESLHGIPYILGAIDGSHIPIIAPSIDPASYYCRKGYYSVLLQGVVDSQCKFWDYDFGWAGSIHDWVLFQKSEIGKRTMSGMFLPYKLIGDAAYPMRPWFYSPFKGEKAGLSREKQHWNFIQSSTRMAVERAFGMLKGRWRFLLKKIDMPLCSIPDMVTACLCLHNLCLIHGDEFDLNWARSAEEELKKASQESFGDFRDVDLFHVLQSGISEMKNIQREVVQIEFNDIGTSEMDMAVEVEENGDETRGDREERSKILLKEATEFHLMLADIYYKEQLKRKATVVFPENASIENDDI
jgi:hypothetical protein